MAIKKHVKKLIPRSFFILGSAIELYRIPKRPVDGAPLADISRIDLDALFRSEISQSELAVIEDETRSFDFPEEAGGVNPGDRRAIYSLVRHLAPRNILEIGTHIGASTLYMAMALKKLRSINPQTSYQLVSVDIRDVNDPITVPWRRYGSPMSPMQMLEKTGCDDLVVFVAMDSLEFFPKCEQQFDLIFLDGSHSSAAVYEEVPAALKVLSPGGYILLHDYFPNLLPLWANRSVVPGPYLATRRLEKEGAPIRVLPLGGLPWFTKVRSKITSLALLGKRSIPFILLTLTGIISLP